LGQTHDAIKEGRICGKGFGFCGSYAESVLRKLHASDDDVVCDDITLQGSRSVRYIEGLS
jgi:hypothetical protein